MDDEYLYIPTSNQQKIISLLVIPPSILSFIGSSLIIYFVRNDKKKTPGRRILFALSVCDIISTLSWLSEPYLMASDAINSYVWTFGNDATCTVLGFLAQFSITSHLYSAALSVYFLLTIRFGVREATFAKKYERWMHVVIILFGLGTAITGVVMGMFHVSHVGPGCWVSHPPEGDVCANDSCGAEKMAWIFAGIPTLLVLVCIAVNNLLLYCHVRATVVQGQKRALESEKRLSIYNKDESQILRNDSTKQNASSGKSVTSTRKSSVLQSSDKQWKRVRDVGAQSFLYVGAYLLCFGCTIAKQTLDGQGFDKIPGSGAYFLPLIVLQSIFLPAQGLFNAVIFFRPKYNQSRTKYPNETRVWSMKRAIFGTTIKPLNCHTKTMTASQHTHNSTAKQINYAGEFVSTASSRANFPALRESEVQLEAMSENVVEEESDFAGLKRRLNSTEKRVNHASEVVSPSSSDSSLPLLVDADDDRRLTMPRISDSALSETPSDREDGLLNGQDIHPMFEIESARMTKIWKSCVLNRFRLIAGPSVIVYVETGEIEALSSDTDAKL
jgi:hypothetical protein